MNPPREPEGSAVKRRLSVICLSVFFLMVLASSALGQQYPPTQAPAGGAPPAQPGQVAQTGSDITLGITILAALIVAGLVLLMVGRRRVRTS